MCRCPPFFADNELEAAVIKQYLTTAADGKNYQVKHYSLQAIIVVGFEIENERAVQFRKWANQIVLSVSRSRATSYNPRNSGFFIGFCAHIGVTIVPSSLASLFMRVPPLGAHPIHSVM
jgi:hypothetical protein